MASDRARLSVRTDPVIELARRGAVNLALLGGVGVALAAAAQILANEPGGMITFAGAVPTVLVAAMMRRQDRPNVVLLLAMICGVAVAAEVVAAARDQSTFVAGIGAEVIVFGLGTLAVFVARERPVPVAVGFLAAAVVPVVVSQVHLNGVTLEIATDVVILVSVVGTLMFLVIRVLDSLSDSQTRYSDLANVVPVATYELDVTAAIVRLQQLMRNHPELKDSPDLRQQALGPLLGAIRISFVNDTARGLTSAYGTWYEFVLGDNAGDAQREAVAILAQVAEGLVTGGGEFTARRLDSSQQDFIYRWVVSRRPGIHAPIKVVLAATDVSPLRKAEAALAQQLRDRDQFVASVSHELRTPLTSIMGLTEELVARPDDFDLAEQAELLEIIASETRDVVDIVEDLLVTARAEAGQLHIVSEPCDLTAEMRRVADLLGGATSGGEVVWAVGDPGRLRQVLRNLLSNAHRHGGPDIRMEVRSEADTAVFEIRDDGDPIPPENRERIFEAYERAAQYSVVGSVGLGLHVARLLARLMGGDLTYRHDGADSIFRLVLPVASVSTPGSANRRPADTNHPAAAPPRTRPPERSDLSAPLRARKSDKQLDVGIGSEVEERGGTGDIAAID